MTVDRRAFLASAAGVVAATALRAQPADKGAPLPSWADGPVKKALLEFVAKTTAKGGKEFVEPAERIAVFDNDGTLW